MKIAITGGKGGTGKSTVATALAILLAKNNRVMLVDMDVDCPDDDIILKIKLKKVKDIKNMIPFFNTKKCIKCGQCAEICQEKAIVFVKNRFPILVPEQCTGCKACQIKCPVNAISEKTQIIGSIHRGKNKRYNLDLVTGKMKPGVEESSLIVNATKKYLKQTEAKYDYIIFDTAAGTHCPVITALIDVDLGIAVTEPTPLGNHDLSLILKLMQELNVPSKTVLNRSDIADQKEIIKTTKKFDSTIITKIPYSKKIQKDYSAGTPITHPGIKEIIKHLS